MEAVSKSLTHSDVAAETVHSISHVCLHCGDFKQAVAYIQEFTEAFPKRSADGLVFQAAVCECYLDSCTEDRRQALKGILQDGVNRRLCCIQHVLWAVGAVHNMGDSALARELADTIQKSECSTADLLLLERLQSALAEGSALNYQALK